MINRAIYSLWLEPHHNLNVGFNSEEALIECMALSLHYSKKWFNEVALITTTSGKNLVTKYNLPFDKITTDLDQGMAGIDLKHWAMGKIYACKIQREPFIHIDFDVILFSKLPDALLQKDAVFQSTEGESRGVYGEMLDHDSIYYTNKPGWYNTKKILAYNCGILGFNKLDFLEEWWNSALSYIDYLKIFPYKRDSVLPMVICEQQFVGCLVNRYNYKVGQLRDHKKIEILTNKKSEYWIDGLCRFDPSDTSAFFINRNRRLFEKAASDEIGYVHLLANVKRHPVIEQMVKERLKLEGISIK